MHLLLFLFLFLQAPVHWTRGLQRRPHSQGQRSKRGGTPGQELQACQARRESERIKRAAAPDTAPLGRRRGSS